MKRYLNKNRYVLGNNYIMLGIRFLTNQTFNSSEIESSSLLS